MMDDDDDEIDPDLTYEMAYAALRENYPEVRRESDHCEFADWKIRDRLSNFSQNHSAFPCAIGFLLLNEHKMAFNSCIYKFLDIWSDQRCD